MNLPNIQIDPDLQALCPELVLGCLVTQVKVKTENPELWQKIATDLALVKAELESQPIKQRPRIAATRSAYKACGKEPSRYRPSAEALTRRIAQGKGLYQVNNVVDLLNLVSIKSGYSIGGFDMGHISGDITLMVAPEGLPYQAIGRGALNIAHFPTLFDKIGPFGTPTSDSLRTMVRSETQSFLMVFYAFDGSEPVASWMEFAQDMLETYAEASETVTQMIAP